MLSEIERHEIDHELAICGGNRRAVCIDALKIIQKNRGGYVPDDALTDLSQYLGLSVQELDGVATFYNLILRKPVGRHVIYLCDSVSCWVMGSDGLMRRIKELLGIGLGETSADGRFTLLPIACLGACDHAPALLIDRDLHGDLRPEHLEKILERYE